MASTVARKDHRLSTADPNSDYSQYLRQQQYQQQREEPLQNPKRPESMSGASTEKLETRPRSHSNHLPLLSSKSSQLSSKSSSSSSSSSSTTSSSASSTHEPSVPQRNGYTLTDTVRPQSAWRPPTNRSKLSMQYTPSDPEDSDDEPLGNTQQKQGQQQQQQQYRQSVSLPHSRFMTGQNVELNGSNNAADSLRAISRMDMDQTNQPETLDEVDPVSLKKKLSLAKRISRFFGGKSSKSQGDSSSSSSTGSSASSTSRSSDATNNKKDLSKPKKEQKRFSSISRISTRTMEVIEEDGKHERSNQQNDNTYAHQRSHSTSDIFSPADLSDKKVQHRVWLEGERSRDTRDSSFDDLGSTNGENRTRHGHRRYSSAITLTNSGPLPRPSHQPRSRQSSVSSVDLLPYQQQQQQLNSPGESRRTPMPPPSPKSGVDERRRNTMVDGLQQPPQQPLIGSQQRRGSTPVAPISEPLIDRIDRGKSTECFQHPVPRPAFVRDAGLDPVLSNLVHQHRHDFKVNRRLGGTGIPPPPPPPQYPPPTHNSPVVMDPILPPARDQDRDYRAPRRDSSGSQSSSYSPHQHPFNTSTITPAPSAPGTPALYPTESGPVSTAHVKRHSASQQGQNHSHPYVSGHQSHFSGNDGNLLYTTSGAKVSPQLQPQGFQYNSQGRQRSAPKRQSSAGYFTLPQQPQQQHQAYPHVQPGTISPFPSPVLGATGTNKPMGVGIGVGTVTPEHSLAIQNQQQQLQLQFHHQQLQQMQQQQIVQQQQYLQAVSPLALLQSQAQQHQQQQKLQLEQLHQMQIKQQHLLLQQNQQLQQQLEQTRAAVASTSASVANKPAETTQPVSETSTGPAQVGLPAAPVLTTAMGLASMNPLNPLNMGMNTLNYPMGMNMGLVNMPGTPMMGMSMNGMPLVMTTPQAPVVAYPGAGLYPSMVNGYV